MVGEDQILTWMEQEGEESGRKIKRLHPLFLFLINNFSLNDSEIQVTHLLMIEFQLYNVQHPFLPLILECRYIIPTVAREEDILRQNKNIDHFNIKPGSLFRLKQ